MEQTSYRCRRKPRDLWAKATPYQSKVRRILTQVLGKYPQWSSFFKDGTLRIKWRYWKKEGKVWPPLDIQPNALMKLFPRTAAETWKLTNRVNDIWDFVVRIPKEGKFNEPHVRELVKKYAEKKQMTREENEAKQTEIIQKSLKEPEYPYFPMNTEIRVGPITVYSIQYYINEVGRVVAISSTVGCDKHYGEGRDWWNATNELMEKILTKGRDK